MLQMPEESTPARRQFVADLILASFHEAAHECIATGFGVWAQADVWEHTDAAPEERAWLGQTRVNTANLTKSQRQRVALAGAIAEHLISDPHAHPQDLLDQIDWDALSASDVALMGHTTPAPRALIQAVRLVQKHWARIEERADVLIAQAAAESHHRLRHELQLQH